MCGTDREIMDGEYGWAPPGEERLMLGHESLGRVLETTWCSRTTSSSVNANQRHFELAGEALARADAAWLEAMISRRVSLDDFATAVEKQPGDVKVVLEL